MSFVHLHCHSEYSLLDGLARIPQMVARARELGQPALALTDHGVMYGAIEFWQAATDAGVKPIIGMEAYLAKGKMSERFPGEENKPYHLLLLAKNMTGYKNLLKLASLAQLEGFYYKPRVDKEALAAHAEGLICTTGCLAAEIPRLLTDESNPEKAKKEIGWYNDVFGPENFFFEIQDHNIPELRQLNQALAELAPRFNARFLATNDVHYVTPGEALPHDVLLCIQTQKLVTDLNRMKMSDGSYYLKSRAEMEAALGHVPGALDHTLLVAEMCELNLKSKGYHLPVYQVPEAYTAETYLRHICEEGLRVRYGARAGDPLQGADDPAIRQRLDYELSVIHKMGFDDYFLIVWDLCRFARSRDIWWNVRGSGAGSIVAYTCGITNLDPLRNSLIFERFLNPGRISMPDIDIDYPDDRRGEMIEYTVQKYGKENVAQIITFGTLGPRAAIRDIGRAMDIPLGEVDRLTKLVPFGPKVRLRDAFENKEFKDLYDSTDYIRTLVDTALQLEGVNRNASTHAAGVVISDKPLVEYLPLHRPTKDADAASALGVVTQFPMEIIEKIGLLKVDFLGLATLTIMRRACELIEQRHGVKYDLTTIPFTRRPDDPVEDAKVKKLFDLLGTGDVDGIFQVESEGMRKVLTSMKPTEFEHIIAVVSLYRPGPMDYIPSYINRMHGKEPIVYHHPDLEPILKETYGIIVYQESIIQIAVKMAGYSPGDADQIRKAVGKKIDAEIAKHKQRFVSGAVANGYGPAVAEAVYGDIEFFANYGFNKCLCHDAEVIDANTGRLVRVGDLANGTANIESTVTLDTNRLCLGPGVVTHVLDNGVKPVYRLTTQLGKRIEATANHPFYAFDGWRLLGELKPGDQIAVPRRIPVEGQRAWPDHEVIVLGHLLAEGNLCHPNGVYYYTTDDEQLRDYVVNLEKFNNTVASVGWHKQSYSVYSRRTDRNSESGAFAWARELGLLGKTAHTKEIPAEAFELANPQITLLIARMWEGDGHINEKGRSLYYATASERMARQLQHLLLRLGIVSRLRRVNFPYRDGRIGYQLFVTGYENLWAFAEAIGSRFVSQKRIQTLNRVLASGHVLTGTRDVVPLGVKHLIRQKKDALGLTWDEIREQAGVAQQEFYPTSSASKSGFTRTVIGRLADFFASDELHAYAEGDVYWDKVVSIEYVGKKPTYDLTVAETHNFVANDFIVHNSHAADYAMITCQTAFLKAHYAVEYMTALLSVSRNDTGKVALYTADCRRMDIPVLPPDVNTSGLDFTIEEINDAKSQAPNLKSQQPYAIRFGMGAIKNVGEGAVQVILDARDKGGPFKSLDDFAQRVDLRQVGRRTLECLIKVGALDTFGGKRAQMLEGVEAILNASAAHFRARDTGQLTLFGGSGGFTSVSLPKLTAEVSRHETLAWEKELIGLYVSDHPLQPVMNELKQIVTCYSLDLNEGKDGKPVVMAGVVTNIRPYQTKKGDAMGFVSVEDLQGHLELVLFPKTWKDVSKWLAVEQIVVIRGKVDAKGGQGSAKILVDSLSRDFKTSGGGTGPLRPAAKGATEARSPEPGPRPPAESDGPPAWLDDELPLPSDDEASLAADHPPRSETTAGSGGGGESQPAVKAANDSGRVVEPVENNRAAAQTASKRAAVERGANGGNGHHNGSEGNGRALRESAAVGYLVPQAPTAAPRCVRVTIHTTGDKDRDVRRMRRIHGLLLSYPGHDQFVFDVVEYNQRNYQISFPNDTTGFCEALERQLTELLGPGTVEVQPL